MDLNDPNTFFQLALGIGLFAFGNQIFRLGVNAAGFALGFLLGFSLYRLLIDLIPAFAPDMAEFVPDNVFIHLGVSAGFGVVGILLARRSYLAMVFISVLAGCLYILYTDESQRELVRSFFEQVGILEPMENTLGEAWYAVLALLVAAAFLYFEKQIIIVITACAGSYVISDTINIPILFLPLCFLGYLVQQKQKPPKKKSSDDGD
mgnify:CR=1 FL=1